MKQTQTNTASGGWGRDCYPICAQQGFTDTKEVHDTKWRFYIKSHHFAGCASFTIECWPQFPFFTPTANLLIATRDDHLPGRTSSLRTTAAPSTIHYDSSKVCHLQTCCPLDSFISVQWLSSSSPELLRPKEIQPIISFRFMLRLLYTESMSVTSESWNSATWKTKVSLYTGFGCPRRMEVLHLDISCPIEFSSVSLTYVSTKEVTLYRVSDIRYLRMKDLENEVFIYKEQGYGVYPDGWTQLTSDTWRDDK